MERCVSEKQKIQHSIVMKQYWAKVRLGEIKRTKRTGTLPMNNIILKQYWAVRRGNNDYSKMFYYKKAHESKQKVYDLQKGICSICNKYVLFEESDLHHINGDIRNYKIDNLTILHKSCHHTYHCKKRGKGWRWKESILIEKFGITYDELEKANIRIRKLNTMYKWEEIKDKPGARYLGLGIGVFWKSNIIKSTGFTGAEIARYLGVTRQCVNGLINKNSPRIQKAAEEIRKIKALDKN